MGALITYPKFSDQGGGPGTFASVTVPNAVDLTLQAELPTVSTSQSAILLQTFQIKNHGGSNMVAGKQFSMGRPIRKGQCPQTHHLEVRDTDGTTVLATQQSQDVYYDVGVSPDNSQAFAELAFLTNAAIAAGASRTQRLYAVSGVPNRTPGSNKATVVAALVAASDYHTECSGMIGDNAGTWDCSRNHALAGTEWVNGTGAGASPNRWWRVISEGPIKTRLEYFTKARNLANSNYHHYLDCRGFVDYWHNDGNIVNTMIVRNATLFAPKGTAGTAGGVQTHGNITCTLTVKLAAATIRTFASLTIPFHCSAPVCGVDASWDWVANKPTLFPVHNIDDTLNTRAYPSYGKDLTIAAGANVDFAPMVKLSYQDYDISATGGRPEIGAMPDWNVKALLLPADYNRYKESLVNGLVPAAQPMWLHNEATGEAPIINNTVYAGLGTSFWGITTNNNTGSRGGQPNCLKGVSSLPWNRNGFDTLTHVVGWDHDCDPTFYAYTVSGDYRYALLAVERLLHANINYHPGYANTNLSSTPSLDAASTHWRTWAAEDQARTIGWGNRMHANASFICPAAHPHQAHVRDLCAGYIAFTIDSRVPTLGAGATLGNIGGENTFTHKQPYMKHYLMTTTAWAGWRNHVGAAKFIEFTTNYLNRQVVDRYLHANACRHQFVNYVWRIREGNGTFYTDFAVLWPINTAEYGGCPSPDTGFIPGEQFPGSYVGGLLMALAMAARVGATNAEVAYADAKSRSTITLSQFSGEPVFYGVPPSTYAI